MNKNAFQSELLSGLIPKNIRHEDALEAYRVVLFSIENLYHAFHYFAAMNLINAYVKQEDAEPDFKKQYRFKEYVSLGIEQAISNQLEGIDFYVTKQVVYIRFCDIQFSFHNISMTPAIVNFAKSAINKPQEWLGVRLQPIALELFEYSKTLKQNNSK